MLHEEGKEKKKKRLTMDSHETSFPSALTEGFFFVFAETVFLAVFFSASGDGDDLTAEEDFLADVFPVEGEAVFFLTALFFGSDVFSFASFFPADAFLVEGFFPASDEAVFAVFFFVSEDAVFVAEADADDFVLLFDGAFFSAFAEDAFPDEVFPLAGEAFFVTDAFFPDAVLFLVPAFFAAASDVFFPVVDLVPDGVFFAFDDVFAFLRGGVPETDSVPGIAVTSSR